jgi:hypothetical protein
MLKKFHGINWKKIIIRRSGELYALLIALVGILCVAIPYNYQLFPHINLKDDKDVISSISTITTTALAVIIALLSYYRFFRGRIYTPRIELVLDVSIHEDPQADFLLHAVSEPRPSGPPGSSCDEIFIFRLGRNFLNQSKT